MQSRKIKFLDHKKKVSIDLLSPINIGYTNQQRYISKACLLASDFESFEKFDPYYLEGSNVPSRAIRKIVVILSGTVSNGGKHLHPRTNIIIYSQALELSLGEGLLCCMT